MAGKGNNMNKLIAQQQQQNLVLQALTQNTALALGGAQNIAMMTQTGMATLAVSSHNDLTMIATSAASNQSKFSF